MDKKVLKTAIEDYGTKMAGLASPRDFLGKTVTVPNMKDRKIVGITDKSSPCIYAEQDTFINLLSNAPKEVAYGEAETQQEETILLDYRLKKKQVALEKGEWPKKVYEVLVNENNKEEMPLNKEIDQKVNGHKLKVTGYYSDQENSSFLLVSPKTVKYDLIKKSADITVCPEDKTAAAAYLQEKNVNVKDPYKESKEEYKKELWASVRSSLIMAGVILAASFIEIFLIIRASFLSRVKEVGVYRAIGVKKGDIYKMFLGEILAITTIASMPGFLFMAYILKKLSGYTLFSNMFLVSPAMIVVCIILLYGFNLVFGLLPVFGTMRKRPAAILSRTDIN